MTAVKSNELLLSFFYEFAVSGDNLVNVFKDRWRKYKTLNVKIVFTKLYFLSTNLQKKTFKTK